MSVIFLNNYNTYVLIITYIYNIILNYNPQYFLEMVTKTRVIFYETFI